MSNNDQQIMEGIKAGGIQQRRWETALFNQYDYLIKDGPKHQLSLEERKYAYADAVMVLIRHIKGGQFRGESTIKTYLHRIFNNKCVDTVRKNTTNKVRVHDTEWIEDWTELSSSAASALKTLIDQEMVATLRQTLTKVGKKCKELLLTAAKGYSSKELAVLFEYKSAQAVRVAKNRCMKKWLEE